MFNFAEQLIAARRAAGLHQAELGARAGVSRMTVGRIEGGEDLRLSTALELLHALGLDLMVVPRALQPELQAFVQSGGRVLGQAAGVGAPPSVVDLLALKPPPVQQPPAP